MSEQQSDENDAPESLFADCGGYYSVRLDGTEFARFAPSPFWSAYWQEVGHCNGYTYAWVSRTRVIPSAEGRGGQA